jgi:hypothetical protein
MPAEPSCRLCTPDPADSKWVTVYPIEGQTGRWMVTVDVTMHLAPSTSGGSLNRSGWMTSRSTSPRASLAAG